MWAARRRTLGSPDFQLLVRAEEACDCGSGLHRSMCCHTMCPPEDGGILWPHFHMCQCSDEVCPSLPLHASCSRCTLA